MVKINPIETIEEANLNPGGKELDTHNQHENVIVHNASQIVYSDIELSVTRKLVNLIQGYYKSPVGEYPLTEFYFRITSEYLEIYDRKGAYLLNAGVGSFTVDEIDWILNNLPLYNTGEELQDTSKIHLDFTELRNEGWMVWRRSGTFNTLIGYIRKNLAHITDVVEPGYYFDNRADLSIVSQYELDIINKFIYNTVPVIDVTDIVVDITDVKMLIGQKQYITITVYPLNSTSQEINVVISNPSVCTFEENVITAKNEGFSTITLNSVLNPEITNSINVEVIEYDKLYNNYYNIIRVGESLYPVDFNYITDIKEGTSIGDFIDTFKNRSSNLTVYNATGEGIPVDAYYNLVSTGMYVTLTANGTEYETVKLIVPGDISGEGVINGYDEQYIRDHVNGVRLLEGCYFIAADVNQDLTVNLNDLNLLDSYIKGDIENLN